MSLPVQKVRAYIGIGSNLADPVAQVCQALQDLQAIPQTICCTRSPLYRSEPVGLPGQPDYINAVAGLDTALAADDLLTHLQAIEQVHGRHRGLRWGPRTLDLDLLLYGDLVQDSPRLTVPHPRLHERAFVLYPLRDIAPGLIIPILGSAEKLLQHCPPLRLERLTEACELRYPPR